MVRNGQLLLWAVAVMGLLAPPAEARWLVRTIGQDVFGEPAKAQAQVNSPTRNQLSIECNAADHLSLRFFFRANPSTIKEFSEALSEESQKTASPHRRQRRSAPQDKPQSKTAKLLIKIDNGDVITFDDATRGKVVDPPMIGATVEGRKPSLMSVIRAIESAKKSINAGFEFKGIRKSEEFEVTGAANAIKTVTKQCKL